MERILCAAIKRKEERNCHNVYYEGQNDILKIEIGYRHPDIIQRFQGELDLKEQGFYTSKGRFVDRKEAFIIAENALQLIGVSGGHGTLYSEDLY